MVQRILRVTIGNVFLRRLMYRASQAPAQYCIDLVKKFDYENYLCTLLMRGNTRRAGFAIRAFNTELACIRDQVSKADIGRGRIAFWREAINEIFRGTAPHHPVAKELLWVLSSAQSSLNKQWFHRLIDGRASNVKDTAFDTANAAALYAENTCSPVYYLNLEFQGVKNLKCDHTASHLGKAQGLSNLIRGVPYNASKGRCYLPLDLMAKHGVSQAKILRTAESNLHEVVFELAAVANLHLERVEIELKRLPRHVHDLYLPMVCLRSFLEILQKSNFNVFDKTVQVRNFLLPWKLGKTKVQQRMSLWP